MIFPILRKEKILEALRAERQKALFSAVIIKAQEANFVHGWGPATTNPFAVRGE